MKHLLTLALLALPLAANALPATPLFGTQRFTPNTLHTVTGPLVQLQTEGGSILSFQQGAKFRIDDTGAVTLTSGNLRVGPAGTTPLTLNLPQGAVTVQPLTALTVTVQNNQTTGRIYQGNVQTEDRTFTTGQGFLLTPSGAHGTFTPAPAQAPGLMALASLEPAAGPTAQTPPITPNQPVIRPSSNLPTTPAHQPEITPEQPTVPTTQPEQPVTETPVENPVENPTPEDPTSELPETPTIENPEPETPQQPELPAPEIPTTQLRQGLLAAFSESIPGVATTYGTQGNFVMSQYANGTQTLEEMQTRELLGLATNRLNRGSALNLDATSHGTTSGLGRWVGGELITVTNNQTTNIIPNTTAVTTQTDDGPVTTNVPNSLHYVWGETPTAIPTSGRVTYNLFSATQPTFTGTTGATLNSTGATFTGNLAIDFAPRPSGIVGIYHFNGSVTMPEVTQTETGPVTNPTTYSFTTGTNGVALTSNFNNPGNLEVTAPTGAAACPSGCSGTVNTAGFGAGMKDAGTLYTINPGATTGIAGAAIFTTAPNP